MPEPEQPSDFWIRRLTGVGMWAGFVVVILSSIWMQVAHSLGVTGLCSEPRFLATVGFVAMGLPFTVLPIWAAFHYRTGGRLLGHPVSRDETPVRWFGGYAIFVAIGIMLLTVAALSWTRHIDFTPKEWTTNSASDDK
jgi:hypothetical protein